MLVQGTVVSRTASGWRRKDNGYIRYNPVDRMLIAVYNRSENIPCNEPSQFSKVPLQMVPGEALLTWETGSISEEANYLDKEKDEALK